MNADLECDACGVDVYPGVAAEAHLRLCASCKVTLGLGVDVVEESPGVPGVIAPRKSRAVKPVDMSLFPGVTGKTYEVISGQITWIAPGAQGINNWKAGRISVEGENVKFVGSCVVKPGDNVRLHGEWEEDPSWGLQFRVSYASAAIGRDYEAIRKLFEADPSFRQIGPKRSLYIAEFLRERDIDLESVLESEELLDELQRSARLPDEAVEHLVKSWSEKREENIAKAELISLGVPAKSLEPIWSSLGRYAVEVIRNDPYVLTELVDNFGIADADKIARTLNISESDPRRIACGVMNTMRREVVGNGHTWISRRRLAALTVHALQIGRAGDHRKTADVLGELILSGKLKTMDHKEIDKEIVCDPYIFGCEQKFASAFSSSSKEEPNFYFIDRPLEDDWVERMSAAMSHPDRPPFSPSEQQIEAVKAFATKRLTAITGAAGTGKTATVTMILRVCSERGLRVGLAAPTGRAAMRLQEMMLKSKLSMPITAMTIHRLLGYQGDRWVYNSYNKLPLDVLILDEMSMTDISLMARLVDAIKSTTAVILVGDHNQLPPVGAGAAFRDVIESELCHVVRLGTVFRQAGALRQNAADVLKGIVRPTTLDDGVETWRVEDWHGDAVSARDSIVEHYRRRLVEMRERGLFEIQVLAPMYKGVVGIDALNAALRVIAHEILYGKSVDPEGSIAVGDKVIQTKNDYQVGLMNGDQGVVKSKEGYWKKDEFDDEQSKGRFEHGWIVEVQRGDKREEVQVPLSRTSSFMLAYAISVHRFQGSEAEHVIGAVHSEHDHMLTRPLIYTTSTRASQTLTLVGDRKGLLDGARKDAQAHRRTLTAPQWLVNKLRRDPAA